MSKIATKNLDVDDVRLNYNPEKPQERFKAAGLEAALVKNASDRLPGAVPWPAGKAPVAAPLATPPPQTYDPTKFQWYEAVVVTWTATEAATLAALFTPGHETSAWYEYRHNIAAYIPLVTGQTAPFNSTQADMARSYHSLGLYFPCKIGPARVLVMKSGLHLDYDGPATPVRNLMAEIAAAVQPKVFITTGTGGGVGSNVALGDVVIAGQTQFFCTTQFKSEPWSAAVYKPTPVPPAALAAITPALTSVNAAKLPHARPSPTIWSAPTDTIVTMDFFGFDDSTDYYKLEAPGHRLCEMGDAMVGQALQAQKNLKWFAIRNVSNAQTPDPNHNINAASQVASETYAQYGAFTTAASVIACWAVINAVVN
jgi:nucleoside phosphorylase